jgi:sugar/nucleoside kinase (ribokinase family)
VGDDVFGRYVAETLNGQGIGTEGLSIDPERATSQTLVVNVKGEDRRFIHSFGANEGFAIEDLDLALERTPRVVFLGYLLILPNLNTEALAKRLARLREAGTLVVIDVATPGPGDYVPQLEPVLPHTDVFLPNTDEARLILGEADPIRQAEIFHEMGAKRVVITRGEFGAVAVSDRLRVKLGTFAVPFVDGSGGGDAFDAGYITAYLDGRDEVGCLTFASVIGASCVRAVGTTTGVFNRREADAFLAANKLAIESI